MTDPITPAARLLAAEADAALARQRVTATAAELQQRLDPRTLAHSALDQATTTAQASLDTARRNPGTIAGVAAVVGLVMTRRPLARLWSRATSRRKDG